MQKRRTDNKAMDYHQVDIDPFHDQPGDFDPLVAVIKQWISIGGVPTWTPAIVIIRRVELLPSDIPQWRAGLDEAVSEAQRLDEEFVPDEPVLT